MGLCKLKVRRGEKVRITVPPSSECQRIIVHGDENRDVRLAFEANPEVQFTRSDAGVDTPRVRTVASAIGNRPQVIQSQ
jgi:hypothetical protein